MLENYPDLHHCILSDALYNVFCELLNVIEINYYLRRYSRQSKVEKCQNLNHGWCNS